MFIRSAVSGVWTCVLYGFLLLVLATPSPAAIRRVDREHCNKTVDIYEDVSSPAVTAENRGKPLSCWYRFRAFRGTPRDWILRVRFKKFKVGVLENATTCSGGYLQIVDGNTKTEVSNRKDPGVYCGESEQPQTFISETSFVRVIFHAENFTDQTYFSFDSRAEQQFEVYLRYGQHPELYPNRRGEIVPGSYCERVFKDCRLQTCYVQSPAYPGIYPRALHCKYRLNTRLPFIKLYIENEEFNIDGQRCENIMTCPMRPISSGSEHCPYDYIRVYDGKNENNTVIGTFCGMGKFPYSIIGTSENLYVEFVSSPAGPLLNTGFHFNVGNWPGHVETAGVRNGSCDWLLNSESLATGSEGIFLSVAHWYPPQTSCSYLLRGRIGEIARLYFPSFRVNRIESPIQPYDGDCGESLTLYDADWPDDARIIKTFCDTFSKPMEKHDFVSTSNALFVRFESKTGSYSGSSLYYWAHYDFFNATRFGEPVPGTECDETFVSWKSRTGRLRSPLNTLVYKRPGDPPADLSCTYTFVTDKRLYARVILTIESVSFKEHPYGQCGRCWDSRVDRLIVREPGSDGIKGYCLCRTSATTGSATATTVVSSSTPSSSSPSMIVSIDRIGGGEVPEVGGIGGGIGSTGGIGGGIGGGVAGGIGGSGGGGGGGNGAAAASGSGSGSTFGTGSGGIVTPPPVVRAVSRGERLDLRLLLDGAHAAANYFKYSAPLFEASYEFAHSPLCGPALLPASTDGEIEFPHYEALGYVAPPRSIKCIWELRVNRERDLWLHFDKIKFASRSCEDGKLEIFLPGNSAEPFLGICGENVSYVREMPIISAGQIAPTDPDESAAVIVQFTGSMAPARPAFKIAWTELYHLPRDGSGALNTQKLEDCGFRCPGEAGCISASLLCNGVVNCPTTVGVLSSRNLSVLEPDDESIESCDGPAGNRNGAPTSGLGLGVGGPAGWAGAGLGAGLAVLLGLACLIAACRLCKRRSRSRDIHVPY